MTHTLRQQLERDGFVHIKQAVPAQDIRSWKNIAERCVSALDDTQRANVISNGTMLNLAFMPEYAPMVTHDALHHQLGALGFEDIRWAGGYLISKPPGGPPLFWHQDWWGWDDPASYEVFPHQLFVMIYLTDTHIKNGCLRVIPGSHITVHPLHSIAEAHSEDMAAYSDENDPAFADHPDAQAVPITVGDILIGDSRLLHGAYANDSGKERPLITLWYAPDFGTQPPAIQARFAVNMRDQDGDVKDTNAGGLPPHQWSSNIKQAIKSVLPASPEAVNPIPWNRHPDTHNMRD